MLSYVVFPLWKLYLKKKKELSDVNVLSQQVCRDEECLGR